MDAMPDCKAGGHAPLPPLPELSDDEKFLLRLKACPSCIKGPKLEEDAIRKQVDAMFRARLDETRFRGESLGEDRFGNRYWNFAGDYSRLWAEKPGKDGVVSTWASYRTHEEVMSIFHALDVHGARESRLRDALELVMPDMEAAMASAREGGVERDDKWTLDNTIATRHELVTTRASAALASSRDDGAKSLEDLVKLAKEEEGDSALGPGIRKLKLDILVVEKAISQALGPAALSQSFVGERAAWVDSVASATDLEKILARLEVLIESVNSPYLESWHQHLQLKMRSEDAESALKADRETSNWEALLDPPVTTASVAVLLYSFDEAIKWPGESSTSGDVATGKRAADPCGEEWDKTKKQKL